ncbi:MAG TPA: AAA family ATPase [Candidatus Nanopelagicales bacterium]|nr:AAA family ATPase [Candidatus Nanopelagicales bacterium]
MLHLTQRADGAPNTFHAGQLSQGTLRALGLLLALHQSPEPSLVLIDEVEDSLHPRAMAAILEAIEAQSERFPVVVTTHSPEILAQHQATPDRRHEERG